MNSAPIQSSNESARPTTGIVSQQPDLFDQESPIGHFIGTDNPRYLRALSALWHEPQMREEIDRRVGCSNGPDLFSNLRDLGLDLPCERLPRIDRDGVIRFPGQYSLSNNDRKLILEWLERAPQVRRHFQAQH